MTRLVNCPTQPFRRFTLLVVILSSMLWLSGCDSEATPIPTLEPTLTPASVSPGASVSERIQARRYLVVGVRYDLPPFGYVTEEGTLAGFDVDLGRELARRWLGDPQAVRFRQVRTDTAVDHLLSDDIDLVLTALLHTQELESQIDFSLPIFEDGQALLVQSSDAASITTPASLEGYLVGVLDGTDTSEALAATVSFTPTLINYSNFDQALTALAQGDIRVIAGLRRRLVRGLTEVPGSTVVGQYSQAMIAPSHVPDQPGLSNLLAFTLLDMYADGSFDEIYQRWFPGDAAFTPEVWPGSATITLEMAGAPPSLADTVAAIQSRGWLQVAMVDNHYPYTYMDANGSPAGYEVHLVKELAEEWLGDQTAVNIVPVTLEQGVQMMVNREADLLIGVVPHTRELELVMDFSLTTYIAGEGLMIQAGTNLGGITGLDGQTVAALSGTDSADVLRRVAQEFGISVVIVTKATLEEAVAALEAGEVIAIVGERTEMLGTGFATPGVGVTADRLTQTPIAIGLPSGDSQFRDLVNLTLQSIRWNGRFDEIYEYWFYDTPVAFPSWPGSPLYPLRISVTPSG